MPLINVKLIEDVFASEQKRRIVEELTDAMVAIEGESMRQVTWVVVEEVRSGDWGIAGKPLITQDVRPSLPHPPDRAASSHEATKTGARPDPLRPGPRSRRPPERPGKCVHPACSAASQRLAFRGMTGTAECDHAGRSCPPWRGEFQGQPKWPSETIEPDDMS
jgi:4-oxalocrotonate tautomerase